MKIQIFFITLLILIVTACRSQPSASILYTKEDILNNLDDVQPFKTLPFFAASAPNLGGSRITLFADSTRWAIVFETTDLGEYGELVLYTFGNCLVNQSREGLQGQFLSNVSFFRIISSDSYYQIVDTNDSSFGLIRKDVKSLMVRNQQVSVDQNIEKYEAKGIYIRDYLNPQKLIDYPSLVRFLEDDNKELFRATDDELMQLLPKDLPKLFVIDEWHHKDYHDPLDGVNKPFGDKPSTQESYRRIADVLVTKDIGKWKPWLPPKNHWKYWVEETMD